MLVINSVAVLACLWATRPVFSEQWNGANAQQPLLPTSSSPARNYSVGFSLSSSYGAAAVIIDDVLDGKKTMTWVVHGDTAYQKTMARLSLEESRYLAPPYDDMQDYFNNVPRVLARRALKANMQVLFGYAITRNQTWCRADLVRECCGTTQP
ncbi:uncharacterized protein LY89DRAFT_181611 [Mollisia scopiformis]|uniref:Uncharacterized protein n=1 Tax=Mollisia scopiformis TaxID=149040 RepID=A0A194XTN9_MOLSC|nr:uncharacterized protein LY89DRAFT_181611 [Mollisia scopiformis]KUJ23409.1 hypothetical protein LY89DRAFT_181611 [Mollisia scopiformis]